MNKTQLASAIVLATTAFSALSAKYSVSPLPAQSRGVNTFAQSIDNSGTMIVTVKNEYNPPIDVDLLDETGFFDDNDSLEDADAAKAGNFTTTDYNYIVDFLLNGQSAVAYQQLALYRSYTSDLTDDALVPGFDEISESTGKYSRSVFTLARDSLDGDFVVGRSEGVYEPVRFTNSNDVEVLYISTFMPNQAFVQVGNVTKRLAPVEELSSGLSDAYAINNQLQVAGVSSAGFNDAVQDVIDACIDDNTAVPDEVCINQYRLSNAYVQNTHRRATVWDLDASGDVISAQAYPLLFQPEEGDEAIYSSIARDINNQGIAVGQSHTGETVSYAIPGQNKAGYYGYVATTFSNGETTEILNREENLQSTAYAINDNNWVAGTALRAPNEVARDVGFVFNLDSGESRFLEGLFSSSTVKPSAVNNNNVVVGAVDVESSNDALRQTHAFRYNIDSDEFIDLNDWLPCDSPYELIEAVDINDKGSIIANARMTRNARNADGTQRLDDAGEPVKVSAIVAVKLSPLPNGEIETCDADTEEKYERQGASTSPLWIVALAGMLAWRRRQRR